MPQDSLFPRYRSGRDVAIEVGEVRFWFSRADFGLRVVAAAARMGLVDAARTGARERDDLVAIATGSHIEEPPSPLAEHLRRHRASLVHDGRDLTYWLRRLVFRDAWLDQQVTDGQLEPVFTSGYGFAYRCTRTGAPSAGGATTPDWAAYGHHRAAA